MGLTVLPGGSFLGEGFGWSNGGRDGAGDGAGWGDGGGGEPGRTLVRRLGEGPGHGDEPDTWQILNNSVFCRMINEKIGL